MASTEGSSKCLFLTVAECTTKLDSTIRTLESDTCTHIKNTSASYFSPEKLIAVRMVPQLGGAKGVHRIMLDR